MRGGGIVGVASTTLLLPASLSLSISISLSLYPILEALAFLPAGLNSGVLPLSRPASFSLPSPTVH